MDRMGYSYLPVLLDREGKERFPRLHHLEVNPEATVQERVRWIDGTWSPSWHWNRELLDRAHDELQKLSKLIDLYAKKDRNIDEWYWKSATNGIFTTKQLAKMVDDRVLTGSAGRQATIKNNLVPGKVEVFMWRVLRKRLSTRVDLDKRGMDLDSVRCPVYDDDVETIDHSLILCRHALDVW
ncbi:uncharacterized protein [Rutidosis leptorrhynchoides]|uniref:uncharacterized protein n=1 Tax=Rutidosis leptorrhynchoides TaxID=125765 RepID=UPI003A9A2252